ncbi:UDP-4-amino-4,6-dideoxy-N-acetyl-beta-L-altrosamine N-acetyltransferase [Algibacillus agarilyticus]|uniref:UDP-4-amino-4, 6-dideoxy-N-acetyl-beta-L-altrosamine N-acetyltransferase n=1 Tax=Algibacillus agarilyticus TaxID=2234133 RepID=UPI000DCFFD40|nr:UDP-4-amino-4,6-dideoxy-N-acetyl-beta-L-altrosamine N-acetyltransferase [Algibacillus agarilyticus]
MFEFKRLDRAHLSLVLAWRLSSAVSEFMFSDISPDPQLQLAWFENLKQRTDVNYWVIYYQQSPIGVISQNDISREHKRCSWGFYIGDQACKNLGGLVPPYFYNFVFLDPSINKITAEVMSNNTQVVKLHKLHGYREVGVWQEHIYKKGNVYDVHLMELHREDWINKKRFKKYIAPFEHILTNS